MMTKLQSLIGHLMEEGAEITQIASKAQRFGIDEVWANQDKNPVHLNNRQRLHIEINDLYAVIEELRELLDDPLFGTRDGVLVQKKKEKMAKYLAYSRQQGQVEPLKEVSDWGRLDSQ